MGGEAERSRQKSLQVTAQILLRQESGFLCGNGVGGKIQSGTKFQRVVHLKVMVRLTVQITS